MDVKDFDYDLPEELIAQDPLDCCSNGISSGSNSDAETATG